MAKVLYFLDAPRMYSSFDETVTMVIPIAKRTFYSWFKFADQISDY
jgi:hypothetical protein